MNAKFGSLRCRPRSPPYFAVSSDSSPNGRRPVSEQRPDGRTFDEKVRAVGAVLHAGVTLAAKGMGDRRIDVADVDRRVCLSH